MTNKVLHLKKVLNETVEPAILVMDEGLNIKYQSSNIVHYFKLPKKKFSTLGELGRLNKIAITATVKSAIDSIERQNKTIINTNIDLKKGGSLELKVQKLPANVTSELHTLFAVSISKNYQIKKGSLNQTALKNESKKTQRLKNKLNTINNKLNTLKNTNTKLVKVNTRLKEESKRRLKELNHFIEALRQNKLELKEVADRYKSLFEHSIDGVVIFDLAKKKVVEVNSSLVKMCGFSKEEIIAKAPLGVMTKVLEDGSSTEEQYFKMLSDLNRKKKSAGNFIHLHKTKAPFHVKVSLYKLPKPNHHLIVVVIKNIDIQKKAEDKDALRLSQLKASESMHKTFFHHSLDAHIILNKEDMMPVEINKRMLKMLHISKSEYFNTKTQSLNSRLPDFFDFENNTLSKAQLFKNIKTQLEKNLPFEAEVYMSSRKRKPFLVKILLNQLPVPNQHLIYTVVKDIDKERKAEEAANKYLKALETSENLFRTFFRNGLDGFGIAQIFPKPKPIDVNLRMLKLTGLSRKEFLNSNILDFMNPLQADNKSGQEVFDEITQSLLKKGFYRGEVVYIHKKNGPFYTNVTMVRLKPPLLISLAYPTLCQIVMPFRQIVMRYFFIFLFFCFSLLCGQCNTDKAGKCNARRDCFA